MSDLMKYVHGDVRPSRSERGVASVGKAVYDEVRVSAMKADGSVALAGQIMKGLSGLNEHRVALAGEDAALGMALAEVMKTAIQQSQAIQRSLFNDWGL